MRSRDSGLGWSRRGFLRRSAMAGALVAGVPWWRGLGGVELPMGAGPEALGVPHFGSRMQAFVWRNWQLVPVERMAEVVGAREEDIARLGRVMGLGAVPTIPEEVRRRSFITVIRRNWHLLPYEQLLRLLGWTAERMEFTLREDDFLFVKLGSLKPRCEVLRWGEAGEVGLERASEIGQVVQEEFGERKLTGEDGLFSFVSRLSRSGGFGGERSGMVGGGGAPRYCYSYFALYGDALLDPGLDPYPDGYLERLAELGVNGVWLQGLLAQLSPFPWDERVSERYEERREQLGRLVERAGRYGLKVHLYLNEPRARSLDFFLHRSGLKGVEEGGYACLCTSVPEVRNYLKGAMASLCGAVPGIGGFFTISGSENLTHCWSHHRGGDCGRCSEVGAARVIGDLHAALKEGIEEGGSEAGLTAWDWGWADGWSGDVIRSLPEGVRLQSVSEWDVEIERGGVVSRVGEYCLSAIGPGPRAKRHWKVARDRGLEVLAKVQVGTTWELASVPYIPAVAQAWEHGAALRAEGVDGLMLGWTLGGHPSPNLEAVIAGLEGRGLRSVAERWHGERVAGVVEESWQGYSRAFRQFPFHVGAVYHAPWHMGPSNLLWPEETGYAGTMVGLPYDDVGRWRAVYPVEVWCSQLEKVAEGFDAARARLLSQLEGGEVGEALEEELRFAEACAIHWRSAATQARWLGLRGQGQAWGLEAKAHVMREIRDAKRLHALQSADSRVGFEASNHYFYVPLDLVEKVVQCRWLLRRAGA